jgi:hypothetical protein
MFRVDIKLHRTLKLFFREMNRLYPSRLTQDDGDMNAK